MLALLLARRGVPVTLLEMHKDFDREFRGDTVHPSTLEILDQLGIAEKVHQIPHSKVYGPSFMTSKGLFQPFDLRRLKSKFPYILLIPQSKFLELLTEEASRYPQFQLRMGANVYDIIRENGSIRGVRYQTSETQAEIRALLTIGADGRHSRVRHLLGFEPVKTSPPMDVLWFKLPKLGADIDAGSGLMGSFRAGRILVILDRSDHWQVAFVFPSLSFRLWTVRPLLKRSLRYRLHSILQPSRFLLPHCDRPKQLFHPFQPQREQTLLLKLPWLRLLL